jgi:hypothetical protein
MASFKFPLYLTLHIQKCQITTVYAQVIVNFIEMCSGSVYRVGNILNLFLQQLVSVKLTLSSVCDRHLHVKLQQTKQ